MELRLNEDLITFGKSLLKTEDLDPMYCAVTRAGIDSATLHRLMLAYSCLYHLGAAAKIAEKKGAQFWKTLRLAAENDGLKWPRGAERRHWRGANATNSAHYLDDVFGFPEDVLRYWCSGSTSIHGALPQTFSEVSKRVQKATGFGPWIAFKVADIGERILGYAISFKDCELGIYKDPRQGAALAGFGFKDYAITDAEMKQVCAQYVAYFKAFKAPPAKDRRCNIQEVETIFCKFKSHHNGHYPMGKDSTELGHALVGWGDLADQIAHHVPGANLQLFKVH